MNLDTRHFLKFTRPPFLNYIYFRISGICPAKCRGCVAKTTIDPHPKNITVEEFERDISRMKELIDEHGKRTHLPPHLDHIDYSGGDPMCNKHWKEIILVGKKYFPKSTVMIRSSGYLLPTMKDEDWKFLADMHLIVDVSEYGDIHFKEIALKLKEHEVNVRWHWGRKPIFTRGALVAYENYNMAKHEYTECFDASVCNQLLDGIFTPCGEPLYCHIVDEVYGPQFEDGTGFADHVIVCKEHGKVIEMMLDAVDIHAPGITLDDLLDLYGRPLHFCTYCRRSTNHKFYDPDWKTYVTRDKRKLALREKQLAEHRSEFILDPWNDECNPNNFYDVRSLYYHQHPLNNDPYNIKPGHDKQREENIKTINDRRCGRTEVPADVEWVGPDKEPMKSVRP